MSTRILPLLALLSVAACASVEAPSPAPQVTASVTPAARPANLGATPVALPAPAPVTTSPLDPLAPPPALGDAPAEPLAPLPASVSPTGALGTTVASLGSPTNPGLWLETALVDAPTPGRVEYNGQSVSLELRPSGGEPGSGSQISLEAMRALGAPLTGLPELTVFGS
ncbi:D-galactarate dehydratase [Rubellimicrobium aerolatum]|uniref:D-galactarate dehydratase n=1 Tax=Rubellimicrobium aerolatum TaxID=490979 RepID=A0ABW0S5V1_9RHOB|nr:D-galactarate dehydratase [Rubellimicrobium aerolatum]MBP1804556.1 hypothetical protein [Rubellimicrobium aerolatum]